MRTDGSLLFFNSENEADADSKIESLKKQGYRAFKEKKRYDKKWSVWGSSRPTLADLGRRKKEVLLVEDLEPTKNDLLAIEA